MIRLNEKEAKLLYALQSNSRSSAKELSRFSRFTHNFTIKKIAEFASQGIISKFSTIINHSAFDYQANRIDFYFELLSKEKYEAMIEYLDSRKNVLKIELLDKDFGISILMLVKDYPELRVFLTDFISKFGIYLRDHYISPINLSEGYTLSYLLNKASNDSIKSFRIVAADAKDIDYLDKQIILQLSLNSRKTLMELSKTLETPPKTIAYRIKKLEENKIILGYTIDVNKSIIGYKTFKINLKTITPAEDILSFAKVHPNIIAFEEYTPFEYSLIVDVSSIEELGGILNTLIERFSNIKAYSYSYILDVRKDSYFSL